LARSDFKVRREERFFTIVGLSHAEYVANRAASSVADYDQATGQQPVADDAGLAVVPALVFELNRRTLEDEGGIFKVQTAFRQCLRPLGGSKSRA
jgi:predicted SpoU family rRNA methylase